eukprot:503131_1
MSKQLRTLMITILIVAVSCLCIQYYYINREPYSINTININDNSSAYFITFYIRMYHGTLHLYQNLLIPSMRLFIPQQLWLDTIPPGSKFELLIVLDANSTKDAVSARTIQRTFPSDLSIIFDLRIEFEEPFLEQQSGHDRQQWSMFFADQFVDSGSTKYIAFIDTDVVFTTIALPQLLFDDVDLNIPLVLGQPQTIWHNPSYWSRTPFNTFRWFHKKEPFMCMNYFPFIMHIDHLRALRQTVMKIHNTSDNFTAILKELGVHTFSQFNIFCSFMWYYHRKEYKFMITKPMLKPVHGGANITWHTEFNGSNEGICRYDYYAKDQYPAVEKAIDYEYFVNKYIANDMDYKPYISFEPAIQVTSHSKYIGVWTGKLAVHAMRFGYCFATHFRKNDTICKLDELRRVLGIVQFEVMAHIPLDLNCFENLSEINPFLYEFEGRHSNVYHPNMIRNMRNHYKDIDRYLEKYEHDWNGLHVIPH